MALVLRPCPQGLLSVLDRLQQYNITEWWRVCMERLSKHISVTQILENADLEQSIASCNSAGPVDLSACIECLYEATSAMLEGPDEPDCLLSHRATAEFVIALIGFPQRHCSQFYTVISTSHCVVLC